MMYDNYGQNGYTGFNTYGQPQFYGQPQQRMQAPAQSQPTIPPPQYGVPIREIRFVTNEEAKAFIVMPNSAALLVDGANGMAYLKTADNLGQSVTEYFRFNKVNPDGTPIKPVVEAADEPKFNADEFVKKVDLGNMGFATQDQVSALAKKIDGLHKKLSKAADTTVTSEE